MFSLPDSLPALRTALQKVAPDSLIVVCYCAAWCDTCKGYQPEFAQLAERHPEHVFVWVDIEENEALLDDHDVENFPTLLVQRQAQNVFFGPMMPQIGHLERLLAQAAAYPALEDGPAPFGELIITAA